MINNIDSVPSIIKTECQEIHFISPKNVKEATQLYYKITEEIATKISSNNKKYGEITKKKHFRVYLSLNLKLNHRWIINYQ